MKKIYIGIAGPIAAGKTTLATELGEIMDLEVYYEDVKNNSYLKNFYNNQTKKGINPYAFPLQIYLLNKRFEQQQKLIWGGDGDGGGIQDRTIYEDSIFAKMLADSGKMSKLDFETYKSTFHNLSNFMKDPHLIIYLDVSATECKNRLKKRNRDIETTVTLKYLQDLCSRYKDFISEISKKIPVIEINYNDFKNVKAMCEKIKLEWENMMNVTKLSI